MNVFSRFTFQVQMPDLRSSENPLKKLSNILFIGTSEKMMSQKTKKIIEQISSLFPRK